MHSLAKYGILLLCIYLNPFSTALKAQLSEVEIKLSGDFYWGEGFGGDRETAINNAKRDLIEKLIVRVVSDGVLIESETDNTYSSEFESSTSTMSRMQLRGLEYLPPNERPNGTWEVIAFVSKSDFEESMSIEEERLLLGLEQALNDEKEGRLDAAIPQYFDLLASTYFFPTPFFTNEEQHGTQAELQSFLRSRINSWINELTINVTEVKSLSTANNIEFYYDLEATYNDNETGFLTISFNRPGYASHQIRDGKVEVFSDILPDEIVENYVFTLTPVIPETLDEDKIGILEEILPSRELSIEIDFSDVIEIDFTVEETEENTFTFIPEVKNISVFDLEWDFGDGTTSSASSPTHQFSSLRSPKNVVLTINQSEELSVTKILSVNGLQATEPEERNPIDQNDPEITNTINDIIEAFVVPFSQKTFIDNVIQMKDGQNLTTYLNRLLREDRIFLGRSGDVEDTDKSYLAVINPDNRSVIAILSPVKSGFRTNLSTNTAVDDSKLSETFRGYGSIWFQFK
ncbi:MAG: PKD domain-containing protein [Balneolales bacterium]|nr:PKD domain-containing protein [Balneolales bacterium]